MGCHQGANLGRLTSLLAALEAKAARQKFWTYFPDEGPLRRALYRKHMLFFWLGLEYRVRAMLSANRVGKTESAGGYELTCHLTGIYPPWWPGRRFQKPIRAWVAGDTRETVRDIVQRKLFGPAGELGTGVIPADCIGEIKYRPNSNGAIDTALIRHVPTGRWSEIGTKSYDQGWEVFQGTERDLIWLDEESPPLVRGECVKRLMTTDGMLIETFTPLKGMTPNVLMYRGDGCELMPEGYYRRENRVMVQAGWDDVPHLGERAKAEMLAETQPYLRDAVSKGEPALGAGAVYPVPESDIVVTDFVIPRHWPRVYALDVGWNRTAALWAAVNRETETVYLYAEHYRGAAEPAVHAQAIRARGAWIPGVIDPAARGRSQKDGDDLLKIYKDLGLKLTPADNSVEAGIVDVWQRLSTGGLKVFRSLQYFLAEYRQYHRNDRGHIVKENDHLMDATRYLVRSGLRIAAVEMPVTTTTVAPFEPLNSEIGY